MSDRIIPAAFAKRGVLANAEPQSWNDEHGVSHITTRCTVTPKRGDAVYDFVMRRDRETCAACRSTDAPRLDHIVSRANGGSNHPTNLQVLCASCNSQKANMVDRHGDDRRHYSVSLREVAEWITHAMERGVSRDRIIALADESEGADIFDALLAEEVYLVKHGRRP